MLNSSSQLPLSEHLLCAVGQEDLTAALRRRTTWERPDVFLWAPWKESAHQHSSCEIPAPEFRSKSESHLLLQLTLAWSQANDPQVS